MDSDSGDDISDTFSCNLRNMNVSVKGPNLSIYRNNNMRGSTQMPFNFTQDARSVYDYGSMNSRRDTSPRSIRSLNNFQPRNFTSYHDLYGMGSQSVFNFQSRNTTAVTNFVTAIDIASSLLFNQFNNKEVKMIEDAYKIFKKNIQHLHSDSEDQGYDLSYDDDDDDADKSMKNSVFSENMASHRATKAHSIRSRTSRQKSVRKRNPLNFRKMTFRNTCPPNNNNNLPNHSQVVENIQPLQKHRFENRYLLPSQRFNKSIAVQSITEKISNVQSKVRCDGNEGQKNINNVSRNITSETENERTLSEETVLKNNNRKEESFKRKLDEDESTTTANKKRPKLSPIEKIPNNNSKATKNTKAIDKGETSGFCFVKPTLPLKKLSRSKIKETPNDDSARNSQLNTSPDVDETVNKFVCESTINSTSDVANRPSFIKRKLFTQTLDVTENKNISCDSVSSPQIVSSSIQKEKNKPRKLGSSVACLDRDVTEETNLIPLIHKIIPLSQISSTTQNMEAVGGNKENVRTEWDVSSVVSGCNGTGGSETYTDEDIFELNATDSTKDNNLKTNNESKKITKNCQVVLEKENLPSTSNNSTFMDKYLLAKKSAVNKQNSSEPKGNEMKSNIFKKTFWDTDFESDIECQNIQKKLPESPKINQGNEMKSKIFKNTFWDTDFESDIECHNIQKKLPESPKINKENLKDTEEISSEQLTKSSVTNNCTATHSDTSIVTNISRLNNLQVRSHRAPKKILCCAESQISSKKGAGTNVKLNSQRKDNNLTKNITRQKDDTEHTVINRSRRARSDASIGKNKQSDSKTGKMKTTTAEKTKKDSKSNERDTSHSRQQSPSNNKTKTKKGQTKPNKVANKLINMQEIESDVSFSLLDTSVRTRSRTKAITELTNQSRQSR